MKATSPETAAEAFRLGLAMLCPAIAGLAALILMQAGALPESEGLMSLALCSAFLGAVFFLGSFFHYYEARCPRCGHACARQRNFIGSGGRCGLCNEKIHQNGDLIGLGLRIAKLHLRVHELLFENPAKRIPESRRKPRKPGVSLRSEIERRRVLIGKAENAMFGSFLLSALYMASLSGPLVDMPSLIMPAGCLAASLLAASLAARTIFKNFKCPSCGLDLTDDDSAMEFGRCPNCSEPYDDPPKSIPL